MALKREKTTDIKRKPERELELLTPSEMVDRWANSIEGDLDRPLSTCIKKFDKDLRNKLRGTVGAYIGYGGTKKSLLALQSCKENVQQHFNNCTGVYANMEMGDGQFTSRLMDMSFTIEDYLDNSSWYFERSYTDAHRAKRPDQKKSVTDYLKKQFDHHYGKNLFINSQSSMSVDDLDRIVKMAKSKNDKVDMLVIDGLSMMKGVGTETESYTTNSKELKDLAKLHNIYIPLICHLSKGADKDTRDVQKHIRGSEKILDNVDFVIQMSLIKDENYSGGFLTDKGYIRFYNKRGSGNTINVIYKFNKSTLIIEETDEDPRQHESQKKGGFFE
jgi:replicative DNA helicase